MAGHAVRWQGTGSDEVSTRDQKSKNPDNLSILGGTED
uniref:CopA/IncA protein n=2 Tax=Salmonella enterica I TaxID=59201 RepID=F5BQQ2_SALDU|nr:CopA/IncA protein [Salmonella enterica subsp. enterica serovar Dublin]AFC61057.1 DNA replication protein [Salmonella enterica subsp. enterica serovar Pullorum]